MMQRKSIIIINPVAGSRRKSNAENRIRSWIESNKIDCRIETTRYRNHANELASKALSEGFNHFVVSGGDGTLNEVASAIYLQHNVSFGIVPEGSGNGLALHLRLPLKTEKALEIAFGNKVSPSDVGLFNGIPFFSVAGVGFDAMVAYRFSQKKGRGLRNYVLAVMQNYPGFKPTEYSVEAVGKTITGKFLMISFANSNQFGNNTSLSPDASLSDGLIDLCLMKKVPVPAAALLSPLLFLKKFNLTRFLKIIRTEKAKITVQLPAHYHIDGDPFELKNAEIWLDTLPAALNIHNK
ncbi:MAG: hypothetical protein A2W93_14540 [Bacteroidetes bacterium GWF2_43_63]|nr:MAG: hypothetical protein A2W94_01110 [Bacteroidetes bacterium GWE2_42_42]OFY52559.1 MAG: hypothetical protein A2W93_14540 [Bacteroidetes bacterium GWF2_43_63]HBG71467.1 hypothetical protein [Bacteroidales bacterium]HCB60781.1 hypothetical protein [Bacteroidales bacterium]HCY23494.1 hypothetical protein [Bacteroidales bacterium]